MRLQLLLILWFALTAWSSQVGASAMAHCQTHNKAKVLQVQAVQLNQNSDIAHTEVQAQHITEHAPSAQFIPEHTTDQSIYHIIDPTIAHQANLHDCCDQRPDLKHCSGSCPSCDGCSTAHGAVMPMVWLMKATIAQQKIDHFDDFYLRPQSSAQERPPKN